MRPDLKKEKDNAPLFMWLIALALIGGVTLAFWFGVDHHVGPWNTNFMGH